MRVDLPETVPPIYVHPISREGKELLAAEYVLLFAPCRIGLAGEPDPYFFYRMMFRIVTMTAVDKAGKKIFRPYGIYPACNAIKWTGSPEDWKLWPLTSLIAGTAIIASKWVPRGKDPVYRFLKKIENEWLPTKEGFQYLLAANRLLEDDYRNLAVKTLVEAHPRPIYSKEWKRVREDIDGRLEAHNIDEQKLASALDAATRIFHEEEEIDGSFSAAYRQAAEEGMEADLLTPPPRGVLDELSLNDGYTAIPRGGKTRRKDEGDEDQLSSFEAIEHQEWVGTRVKKGKRWERYGIGWDDIFSEYTIRVAYAPIDRLIEREELERRYDRLSAEDRLTVDALYANNLDYEATMRELRIENSTLRQRIHRIRDSENNPANPFPTGTCKFME